VHLRWTAHSERASCRRVTSDESPRIRARAPRWSASPSSGGESLRDTSFGGPSGASRRARRVASALALSFAALLTGASIAHAGPGVTLTQGVNNPTKLISGGQISGSADASGTYNLRERPGDPGKPISLSGLSMRGLLSLAGYNPGAVRFVQIVGGDGSVITVTGPEINSPPFPDGPALVSDNGATTRFVKPSLTSGGTSQSVASVPGTPIEMTVEGGSLLSVRATASPSTVKVGQTVTFHASVAFAPPGASFTYEWDFGDGSSASGATVTHQYELSGDFTARVTVHGTGGSGPRCNPLCDGPKNVFVTVTGQEREGDLGTPQGGGDASSLGGTGTGGTGSGTGSGGGGTDLTEFGGYAPKPERKPPPIKQPRPEPHSPFSSDPASGVGKTIVEGILLAGTGQTVKSALSKGAPAGNPKPRKGTPGTAPHPTRISIALILAMAIMSLGALRERRRVRLRLA